MNSFGTRLSLDLCFVPGSRHANVLKGFYSWLSHYQWKITISEQIKIYYRWHDWNIESHCQYPHKNNFTPGNRVGPGGRSRTLNGKKTIRQPQFFLCFKYSWVQLGWLTKIQRLLCFSPTLGGSRLKALYIKKRERKISIAS